MPKEISVAITKEKKELSVASLSQEFGRLKLAVLTDYRGLTAAQIKQLRDNLREQGISYKVTKNTLVKLAAQNTPGLQDLDLSVFNGPLALAIGFDDEIAPAKAIFQFAKQHDVLKITGAITADGQLLSADQVKALAILPTREELLAKLAGTLAAPISGLLSVMAASPRSIINVLQAISKLENQGE